MGQLPTSLLQYFARICSPHSSRYNCATRLGLWLSLFRYNFRSFQKIFTARTMLFRLIWVLFHMNREHCTKRSALCLGDDLHTPICVLFIYFLFRSCFFKHIFIQLFCNAGVTRTTQNVALATVHKIQATKPDTEVRKTKTE